MTLQCLNVVIQDVTEAKIVLLDLTVDAMLAAFGYPRPFVVQTSLDVQEPEEQIRDAEDDLSTQGSGQL